MTNLSSLKSVKITKPSRRLGRGHGSKKGKTSGRGHKGAKSRSGSTSRLRYEGGQNPFISRIPKLKGFTNINTISYQVVNVSDLPRLAVSGRVSKKSLIKTGYLTKKEMFKVLGDGDIKEKITVEVDAITGSAREKIEKAGGKVVLIVKKSPKDREKEKK